MTNANAIAIDTTNTLNTKDLKDLGKAELIELLIYADALAKTKGVKPKGPGRKAQVLKVLQSGPATIEAIAKAISTASEPISHKNVSSQLSYLRKDGVKIGRNSANQLLLEV